MLLYLTHVSNHYSLGLEDAAILANYLAFLLLSVGNIIVPGNLLIYVFGILYLARDWNLLEGDLLDVGFKLVVFGDSSKYEELVEISAKGARMLRPFDNFVAGELYPNPHESLQVQHIARA